MAYRSYTAAEYRKAGPNAGPYALEANGQYRTTRRKPILGVVMHITAGLTDYTGPDSSAEGTTKYGASMARQASWHVCIDSDGIIPSVRDSYCAWHAGVQDIPNVNDATLGIEQGTGQVDWRKAPKAWVASTLRNVAVWLAPRVVKYKIPLVVIRDRNVMDRAIRAGKPFGFISHGTVAPHNRVDPGLVRGVDTYPWEQLFGYVREEIKILGGAPAPTDKPSPPPVTTPAPDPEEIPMDQTAFNGLFANAFVYALRQAPTVKQELNAAIRNGVGSIFDERTSAIADSILARLPKDADLTRADVTAAVAEALAGNIEVTGSLEVTPK